MKHLCGFVRLRGIPPDNEVGPVFQLPGTGIAAFVQTDQRSATTGAGEVFSGKPRLAVLIVGEECFRATHFAS